MTGKVLFLDVDGVLNYQGILTVAASTFALCPLAIARLHHVLSATGAKIVLSSSWRYSEDHVTYLWRNGVLTDANLYPDPCHWRTPVNRHGYGTIRGDEVQGWLERQPDTHTFTIIDDDADFHPEQVRHFVHTDYRAGMLDAHQDQLIALLGPTNA